jgi:outer membrane biogenesis lipoprotein LolB
LAASGCAVKRFAVPTDAGTPFPDFQQIHSQIAQACVGVRTLRGELGLSGRAGEQRVRGPVVAGFEQPASMRLEGRAPFGAPAFILVARAGEATLVLPREGRVVRDARPEEILGALTGVALAPSDLQAILTGCLVPSPRPVSGRLHAGGVASIDLEGGATLYLRRSGGAWQLRAGRRDGWVIEYPAWNGGFPGSVRLQSSGSDVPVDLTATLSQIEANIDISPDAFSVNLRDMQPMTLEELRAAGPLRGNP